MFFIFWWLNFNDRQLNSINVLRIFCLKPKVFPRLLKIFLKSNCRWKRDFLLESIRVSLTPIGNSNRKFFSRFFLSIHNFSTNFNFEKSDLLLNHFSWSVQESDFYRHFWLTLNLKISNNFTFTDRPDRLSLMTRIYQRPIKGAWWTPQACRNKADLSLSLSLLRAKASGQTRGSVCKFNFHILHNQKWRGSRAHHWRTRWWTAKRFELLWLAVESELQDCPNCSGVFLALQPSLQSERQVCPKKTLSERTASSPPRRKPDGGPKWWPHIVASFQWAESAKSTRMAGQKMIGNPQFWQAPNSNSVKSSTIFACC